MITLTPPTKRGYVSSTWGADRSYRGGWHAGLDFPDEEGAPILASARGVVTYVKPVSNSYAGKYLVIDHGGGVSTRYLHAKKLLKKAGDVVERGEIIGEVGTTGTKNSPPHVHFDVKFKPEALRQYQERYGVPATGFSKEMQWGRGAPAEALMSRVSYKPSAKTAALARGVWFYKADLMAPLLLASGLGYLLYRYLM